MRLTLFDLDDTLLAGDSDFAWARFLVDQGVLDREAHEARNREFLEQYRAGTLDIRAFLDFQLGPLARHPRARLELWLAGRGLTWGDRTQSRFYSDSRNDLPLLSRVDHPVAVDPDNTLREHAERRGWPVISLR